MMTAARGANETADPARSNVSTSETA